MKDLRKALEQRQQLGLYRQRRQLQSPQGRLIQLNGQSCLNFCSNDYLGFASHPKLIEAFTSAARATGVGSGSAHLVNGHHQLHHQLEEALAEFTGYPRALLFSTGYMANLGLAQSLCGRHDTVIEDKLNHASLLDAAQLSGARLRRYPHLDYEALQQQLERSTEGEILVSSDAVFSMDGDQLDIARWQASCQPYNAWLMLDDAHGFGVLGEQGRGSLNHQGTGNPQMIYMATLGKALGTSGAFVAGSEDLIEYLIQFARSYIYTTAMPPAVAAATLASLQLLQQEPEHQQALKRNIHTFKSMATQASLPLMPSDTAIQPLLLGDAQLTVNVSQQLFTQGIHLAAIRPPTVPEGSARLRITLRADHQLSDLEQLVERLQLALAHL